MLTKKKKLEIFEKNKIYSFEEGIEILKNSKKAKFNETIEIAINLKITPPKKNFSIKGFSIFKNKSGKTLKTAVFLDESEIDSEIINKADIILNDNEIKKIKNNDINFDIIITNPKSIIKLGEISRILGPKGLMPNIKYGTITNNIKDTLDTLKKNYMKFKNDKNNIIHGIIGKIDSPKNEIKENAETLIRDIKKNKPIECKNMNIHKINISSTMGPGINININSLNI